MTKDVTHSVDVADPESVLAAVKGILEKRYPQRPFRILDRLFADVGRLYRGKYPGFHRCETDYHDLQHVLDVTLAFTRLADGYEEEHEGNQCLGPELCLMGVIAALFHDSGYIRRTADKIHHHGAEYTKVHVSRSAQFMAEYLPTIGLGHHTDLATKIVHFTGYELSPESIALQDHRHHVVGALVGTADVIAQMADHEYLQKCYQNLYREFEIAGVTKCKDSEGNIQVIYASPEELLRKTPHFMRSIVADRLDGYFAGRYRYVESHFDGANPYMKALHANQRRLEKLLQRPDAEMLACLG